jgi:hypothetical protein
LELVELVHLLLLEAMVVIAFFLLLLQMVEVAEDYSMSIMETDTLVDLVVVAPMVMPILVVQEHLVKATLVEVELLMAHLPQAAAVAVLVLLVATVLVLLLEREALEFHPQLREQE